MSQRKKSAHAMTSKQEEHHVKTLILGAGVAGITAARIFRQYGFHDYAILESQNRIGGRVYSVKAPGGDKIQLPFGASYIHSTHHNPFTDIVSNLGLTTTVSDENNFTARNSAGQKVTSKVAAAFDKLRQVQRAVRVVNGRKKTFQNELDYSQRCVLRYSGWNPATKEEILAEVVEYDIFYGDDPDCISTRYSDDYDRHESEQESVEITDPRGYQYILHRWIHDPSNGPTLASRIKMGEVVNKIEYSDSCVTVHTCTGAIYRAEYVICTFSIGVLQSGRVEFLPELPIKKLERIHSIKIVNYKKVFLGFDGELDQVVDKNDYVYYAGDQRGYFSHWTNMKTPGGSRVMIATLVGAVADQADTMTQDELKQEAVKVLRNMYGPSVPSPKWVMATNWKQDPSFYGSYCLIPVGFCDEDLDILKSPLLDRVYFAGDTYSNDAYGEVATAYETGKEAALCILKHVL